MREIVIDSFAGGGGASTGIEWALQAMGAPIPIVDIAINHSGAALAMHAANHPETLHLEADILTVDPLSQTAGRPVGLLWASPDCRHFSRTKGQTPLSKKIRGLAWSIAHWAEQVHPRIIMLENVPEFLNWGPLTLDANGNDVPDRSRAGETFAEWLKAFKKLGYRIEWRKLCACDYGAPTSRERLYIIMRNDGQPIVWPAPTHGDPRSDAVIEEKLLPWDTARDIVEWDFIAPTIFVESTRLGMLGIARSRAENTMSRIARGVQKFVLGDDPCVVNLWPRGKAAVYMTAHYGNDIGSSAWAPLRTITGVPKIEPVICKLGNPSTRHPGARRVADLLRRHTSWTGDVARVGDQAIVDIGMRGLTPMELAKGQGFPPGYILAAPFGDGALPETAQKHKIGNSVCPDVAYALVTANYRPEDRAVQRAVQGWLFEHAVNAS